MFNLCAEDQFKDCEVFYKQMLKAWKTFGSTNTEALELLTKNLKESEYTDPQKLILLDKMFQLVKEVY